MVGQAPASLVSGDRKARRSLLWWLTTLNIGFLAGSGAVMTLAWGLGSVLGTDAMSERLRLSLLLLATLVFLVFDIPAARRGGASRLGLSRQTPKRLMMRIPRADTTALVWGTDIGTGVSTYRMTSGIWLGLFAVFLGLVPFWVGWLYGAGVIVTITALTAVTGGGYALQRNLPALFAGRRPIQFAYVGAAVLVAAASVAALPGT